MLLNLIGQCGVRLPPPTCPPRPPFLLPTNPPSLPSPSSEPTSSPPTKAPATSKAWPSAQPSHSSPVSSPSDCAVYLFTRTRSSTKSTGRIKIVSSTSRVLERRKARSGRRIMVPRLGMFCNLCSTYVNISLSFTTSPIPLSTPRSDLVSYSEHMFFQSPTSNPPTHSNQPSPNILLCHENRHQFQQSAAIPQIPPLMRPWQLTLHKHLNYVKSKLQQISSHLPQSTILTSPPPLPLHSSSIHPQTPIPSIAPPLLN